MTELGFAALRRTVFCALLIAVAPQHVAAQVIYEMRPTQPWQDDAFKLITADFVQTDASFSFAELVECWLNGAPCISVNFYVDTYAAGLTSDDRGWQAVGIRNMGGGESFTYFTKPAFTSVGIASRVDLPDWHQLSILVVSEPGSVALLLFGLPFVLAAIRRKTVN